MSEITRTSVQIELPASLCLLSGAKPRLALSVAQPVTQRTILDALELLYPALRGTLRDQGTGLRRPYIRFFACEQDLSSLAMDDPIPTAVSEGAEPFLIIGAISGG